MEAVLIVTWFVGIQMSSYQVAFATMPACVGARSELLREERRLVEEGQVSKTYPGGITVHPGPSPKLTAVCARIK